MEPMTEADIREFLSWRLPTISAETREEIAKKWIEDRVTASEFVMQGNSIIE